MAYGLLALLVNIGFLMVYAAYFMNELTPPPVPRWMVPSELSFYAVTFLMPTVAHAALVLLVHSVPDDRPISALPSFGVAAAVLLGFVLLFMIPWGHLPGGAFWQGISSLVIVAGTLAFLMALSRGAYILLSQKAGLWEEYQLVFKVLIAAVLPLVGLAVNNGLLFGSMGGGQGIFGDFGSPWFYGLALANALLLCLPAPRNKWAQLVLLAAHGATLPFTLYFFVVFLPFLPLSVLALLLIGLGFLLLAPLLLLLVHLWELSNDFERLRGQFEPRVLVAVVAAGALVLPLAITGTYLHDRRTLHAALAYLYAPDYSRQYNLDEKALLNTLAAVQENKTDNGSMFGSRLPYLTSYFNWIVLDNLTLSNDKLDRLHRVFAGTKMPPANRWQQTAEVLPRASLSQLASRSTYNARQAAWVSWVELEMKNGTGSTAEYATMLALPPGCWVKDYYLDIGKRREHGILAEQKAATWVFAQILNEGRQDPGLLHYLSGNEVALRVFPFAPLEVRRTGICLVHKEPVALVIDGQSVQLGSADAHPVVAEVATTGREVVYISRHAKQALPLVQRQPYYHFLLDVSTGQQDRKAGYARRVQSVLSKQPLPAAARFSLVNAYTRTLPANADWQQELTAQSLSGGFYAGGAIRQILTAEQRQPTLTYPVLVLVTDQPALAVLDADFADFRAAYPESSAYFVLAADGLLQPRSLLKHAQEPWPDAPAPDAAPQVRAWPTTSRPIAFLPDDEQPNVVLAKSAVTLPATINAQQSWQTGLLLQGYWQQQTMYPAAAQATRIPAIQTSFRSGIMTPLTAYLSLENDAQKAALRRKQKEVLDADAALDAGETSAPTTVPIDGGATLLLAAGGLLGLQRLRQRSARKRK
ncbi:hypothetical protein GCM10023186_21350 [Hymenobacter koreensis]|uniref:MSEP-CTERM sorting domain-containing protein n=1 Tax=Hymenobacter koreensis TaxID=1084523 RepID=A0ABP8J029_9BACT